MPKMAVLPTQAEVVDIRERLPNSLESAAAQINRYLGLADRANSNANMYRIYAGQELVRIREKVPQGEWKSWCKTYIWRSLRDIRKLIQIAEARDSQAALEKERTDRREGMAALREKRSHVGPVEHVLCLFVALNEDQKVEFISKLKELGEW